MISEKLMMSLLALDAYSRSSEDLPNDVRLFGLGGSGSQIGDAAVTFVENTPESSFVAVAYSWNGKTVLSFRGTDSIGVALDTDVWSGWTIGTGWDGASQAGLAASFYEAMTGQDLFAPGSTDVMLTGHSLGGGLAGYLSALNGTMAYGFDHMVFGPAAERTMASYLSSLGITDPTEAQFAALGLALPNSNRFISSHVSGEILEGVRDGNLAGLGADVAAALAPVLGGLAIGASWLLNAMGSAQAAYENVLPNGELSTFGWAPTIPVIGHDDGIALHSQGLLVLLQFAQDEVVGGQWITSGLYEHLLSALYKDEIAESAGIFSGNLPGSTISGKSTPADLMLTKIAYTVLDSGNRPFGDSAIRSLFNDAESIGDFINDGGHQLLDAERIAEDIARFAALQAHHAVIGKQTGFISHGAGMIALDYTRDTWTFGSHIQSLPGFARDFSTYLTDGKLSAIEKANLDSGPGRFDYEFYSNASGGWQGQIGHQSDIYTVKAVGTQTWDTVIGTDGDEQIVLGAGNDTVKANGGVNWIDGGEGDDTLIDDHAWADFDISFDAEQGRYYLALRNSGAEPRIHVVENVEQFQLNGELFEEWNILNGTPVDIFIESIAGQTGPAKLQWGSYGIGTIMADLGAVDPNMQDQFSWEIVGGSSFYDIDSSGVVRAKATAEFDWSFWSQRARYDTYEQWQLGQHSGLLASLLGTQYGFTVKVTDAAGASHTENFYFYLQGGDRHAIGTDVRDVIYGSASARDIIHAFDGDDEIHGLGGDDDIYGGGGNDDIFGGSGTDRIWGGNGEDYIEVGTNSSAWGEANDDELVATGNNNTLNGGSGGDTLRASGNGNILIGGTDADNLISASGKWNTASYKFAMEGVSLAYDGINGVGAGSGGEAAGDTLSGIFDVEGSSHADTINMVLGAGMVLRAGAGNDTLHVQITDYSVVHGDADDDTIIVTKNPFTNGYGKVYGGAGNDAISGHGELHGGTGADTITSAQGDHKIYLGVDNDVDTFVFSRMKGFDQVYDFTSIDQIRIGPGYKYEDFGDVMANSVQTGAHVDIWFESDTKITIMNFQKTNLTADNFLFD